MRYQKFFDTSFLFTPAVIPDTTYTPKHDILETMQQSHTHITSGVVAKEPFRATLFIAQGGLRVKPDMKPWVNRAHKN